MADAAAAWTYALLPHLIAAALVLAAGLAVIHFLMRGLDRSLAASKRIDLSIRKVLATSVRYGLTILVLAIALHQLGVETTSLIAVLGAAGLAIGLALQGTLTNIAAGVMLLWLRPFQIGDYIEVSNQSIAGMVEEIGLFSCLLKSPNGVRLFVPNAQIWNYAIENYRTDTGRVVEFLITLSPQVDMAATSASLEAAIAQAPFASQHRRPRTVFESVTADGYTIALRFDAAPKKMSEALHGSHAIIAQSLLGSAPEGAKAAGIARRVPAPGSSATYFE